MKDFTLSELGVFLGVVGGIMTSVLLTIQNESCASRQPFAFWRVFGDHLNGRKTAPGRSKTAAAQPVNLVVGLPTCDGAPAPPHVATNEPKGTMI